MRAALLSADKALSIAINSEHEAENVYKVLMKKVKNFMLKDKLKFLYGEEKKHRQILLVLFEKMFPTSKDLKIKVPI